MVEWVYLWSLWIHYNLLLKTNPLVTKMATAGVMTTISDTIAQAFTAALDGVAWKCDATKTTRLMLFATFYMGPSVHFWNRLMEAVFAGFDPVYAVTCKVALDQTAFTLVCNLLTIAALTWAERRPMSSVSGRIRTSIWPLMKANWKIWGPTMCLVYAFVEEDLRPLVLNTVSIGWQIFYLMLLRPPTAETKQKTLDIDTADSPTDDAELKRSGSKTKLKESPLHIATRDAPDLVDIEIGQLHVRGEHGAQSPKKRPPNPPAYPLSKGERGGQ